MRRVTGHRAFLATWVHPAQATKIFLPSPSVQGLGTMRLHSGARPVDRPAALPSLQFPFSAAERISGQAQEAERIASDYHE